MSRWIRLQTSIFEHELFAGKEFSERDAWVSLIAKAAWRETRHRVGKEMAIVPAGSLFVTLRELQSAWRWGSDFRVRSFLKLLQAERMISVNANAGKTQITICNYGRYQHPDQEENAPKTQDTRAENARETQGKRTKDTSNTISPFFERERAGTENSAPDGFQDWFSIWPTALTDDKHSAFAEWQGLSPDQRSAAASATPGYIEAVKASGRKTWPSAAKFLAHRLWERIVEKPQKRPNKRSDIEVLKGVIGANDSGDPAPRPSKSAEEIKAEKAAAEAERNRKLIEHNRSWGFS